MYICENCGNSHDGTYGSGRFCSKSCRMKYIGKQSNKNGKLNTRRGHYMKHKTSDAKVWMCYLCGEIYPTRRDLQLHLKDFHNGEHNIRRANRNCQYCGRSFRYQQTLIFHERYCKENPNHVIRKGHPFLESSREKLSRSLKKAYQEGRHPGWAASRTGPEGMSYPEQFFTKVIIEDFDDKEYVYNLPFFTWKLDFTWVKKKYVIEIDGSQHELPKQKESDIRKDAKLNELGWKVMRIRWIDLLHDTQYWINAANNFINSGVVLPVDDIAIRSVKNSKIMHYGNEPTMRGLRRVHNAERLPNSVWIERRTSILASGVDLHKPGWVNLVCKLIGYSRRIIYETVCKFDMNVYMRKSPKTKRIKLNACVSRVGAGPST